MGRDSSFCAKSVRYNIFTNGAPYVYIFNQNSIPAVKCEVRNLWGLGVLKFSKPVT